MLDSRKEFKFDHVFPLAVPQCAVYDIIAKNTIIGSFLSFFLMLSIISLRCASRS